MKHIVFDIEGNGLNEINIDKKKRMCLECDRVHLLVLRSFPDGEVRVFRNNDEEDTIAEGWAILKQAETVIGHGIIAYDLPVLTRLYGGKVRGKVWDTLVAARVIWPDAKNHPLGGNGLPHLGRHLDVMKGDYDGGWEAWNEDMEIYCIQDTLVSRAIFNFIKQKVIDLKLQGPVRLEHRVATICAEMQDNGVSIDVPAAEDLIEVLEVEQARCYQSLQESFPPRIETMKTPQYWVLPPEVVRTAEEMDACDSGRFPRKKDAPAKWRKLLLAGPLRTKEHPFNPGSGYQIAERLLERYGWVAPRTDPTPDCPDGNPSCTEEVLKELDYPEVAMLLRAIMADMRLKHLADWTRRARASRTPGRIHPQINPCGCATFRPSHQQPNQTACPKVLDPEWRGVKGRYGWEMRSLWGPREGWVMVGGDASSLELRMLAHALFPYDGGAYAKEVMTGDVHQKTADATGMTRGAVKEPTFATLYGVGNPALAKMCKGKLTGKQFRDRFEGSIPGFTHLKAWCAECANGKGWIPMIDGRRAPIRKEHAAINTLLQGTGILVMKVAMVIFDNTIKAHKADNLCGWMLWPHDEFQMEAHPSVAEGIGQAIVGSIKEAGRMLKLNVELDGEYKVGRNWAETH